MTDDARRRDFTINALYAAPDGRVADPLGGMADLTAHRIRFIEDPAQRIKEDYLRILRFFRFYAWYGNPNNGPDRDGLAACAAHIDGLQSLSVERITAEVLKFLSAPDPAPAMAAFASTGGLSQILPGADAGALAVLVHLEGLSGAAPDPVRRLAVLGGNADAGLRLSKGQLRHLAVMKQPDPPVTLAYRYGYDAGRDALLVMAAVTGQPVSPQALSSVLHAAKQKFPLTAKDLMPELSGAALGKALTKAEKRWIDSGFRLTKAELLD
jgi:poly(A) polymerase